MTCVAVCAREDRSRLCPWGSLASGTTSSWDFLRLFFIVCIYVDERYGKHQYRNGKVLHLYIFGRLYTNLNFKYFGARMKSISDWATQIQAVRRQSLRTEHLYLTSCAVTAGFS